ncbi:MAG: OmpA family protein, partial [Elusimicrobiales bacterium]|nr:OmpA family protein [Elusimicrobiales bacterium]
IDLYKNTDGKAKIIIEGYSSNGGNETANNPKLSQQRAKAVASYMIKEGISKENLEVKAYGNTKTGSGLFANDKGCKGGQCYRRVNVRIAK